VRTFETTTARLIELAEWLEANGCTHVAMEATGVYWKPVWQVLAGGGFELVLANAAHVKNVPGRKTDVNDATWLAELLAHGLIRASFVPGPEIQELRGLLRTRKQLVREKASHVQRLQKTLEGSQHQTGVGSVRRHGPQRPGDDPSADRRRDRPCQAGRARPSQGPGAASKAARSLARASSDTIASCSISICSRSTRSMPASPRSIGRSMPGSPPFVTPSKQLSTIPGVSELSAQVILSEIGVDMSWFATAAHLCSWAGLCPRNDESAGKRRSTRLRTGCPWLKATLVQRGWAAARTKATYLNAQFVRLRARRGPKKAVCAVAASHPHGGLSHAQRRHILPRPRGHSL
jgi:transposase